MRSFVKLVGYSLVALILAGLVLTVLLAVWSGQAFYGHNVYGLALGTYSTLAVLLICAAIGVAWLLQRIKRRPE